MDWRVPLQVRRGAPQREEKAVQEWQRAMKSPSPSKWRASDAVRQLEADTIALAAGAVTAMLAANAAAAGPLDSPEKVSSGDDCRYRRHLASRGISHASDL